MRLIFLLLLTLNLNAERIIALTPSITDILFALGRGSEVVGVSDYTFHPKEATTLPSVGGYFYPNIERVLSLKPTLVIAQPHHNEFLQSLKRFGIKTEQVKLETIDEIKSSIAQLGKKQKLTADKLIANIDSAITKGHSYKNNNSVIIVFGLFSDLRDNIYISGQKLFFSEIIELCGAKNAFTHTIPAQPVLNYESLIALNPDRVIILNGNRNIKEKEALKSWYAVPINAAKNKKIRVLNQNYISLPSQRIALSIDAICKAIHD